MNATVNTTTGEGPSHRTVVQKSKDYRTLKLLAIGSAQGVVNQLTTTTVETWTGLDQSDAVALCKATTFSVKDGTERPYLGGVKITVGGAGAYTWTTIEECWGTQKTSSIQRIGDTNLYDVQTTTTEMTVTASGGTIEWL